MMLDQQSVYLQLTSGQGPQECALAVAKLFEHMKKEAAKQAACLEIVEAVEGAASGTYSSMLIQLTGKGAEVFSAPYVGTIQWICESPYRPKHKRKNWFVGITLVSLAHHDMQEINPADISWKAVKASGPGGQHVNTTDSAVQAHHLPSGVRVTSSEGRSQHDNKKRALEKIRAVLSMRREEEKKENNQQRWQNNNDLERGNPVKVFVGQKFKSKR